MTPTRPARASACAKVYYETTTSTGTGSSLSTGTGSLSGSTVVPIVSGSATPEPASLGLLGVLGLGFLRRRRA